MRVRRIDSTTALAWPRVECLAVDDRHRDEHGVVGAAGIETDDVRMLICAIATAARNRQGFWPASRVNAIIHRDAAIERRIVRLEHAAECAATAFGEI
jgi:hypothetical protein